MQRSNSGYGNRSHDVKHTSNNQDWRREFITLASLLIMTRVLDGLITYAITPDLSRETNPLVSIFGLGWAGLIIVTAILLGAVIWLNYQSLSSPCDNFPPKPGVDWCTFQMNYFDVRGDSLFARHPGRVLISIGGYVLPRVIIIWSILVLIHNGFVYASGAWEMPICNARVPLLIHMLLPALCYALIVRLQRRDFQRYCTLAAHAENAESTILNHHA